MPSSQLQPPAFLGSFLMLILFNPRPGISLFVSYRMHLRLEPLVCLFLPVEFFFIKRYEDYIDIAYLRINVAQASSDRIRAREQTTCEDYSNSTISLSWNV